MKLIIDIPEERFEGIRWAYNGSTQCDYLYRIVAHGTPLDDVKEQMKKTRCFHVGTFEDDNPIDYGIVEGFDKAIAILDNIGKTDKRSKIRCNTCKNNDDELSGECYECIKGIFDHYEPQESEADFPQAKDIGPTVKGFVNTMDILDHICKESEK